MTDDTVEIRTDDGTPAPVQAKPPRKPPANRDKPLDENELYVRQTAKVLNERLRFAIHQIRLLVQLYGRDNVQEVVEEVLRIEANGGMLTRDGARRRTPGGVFFYLIRPKLTAELEEKVFGKVLIVRQKVPPFPRERLLSLVEAALRKPVEVREPVRIVLVGRPESFKRDGTLCVTSMQNTGRPGSVPLRLPEWPSEPTNFVIYMLAEHWDKLAQEYEQYPESQLYVDGQCALDRELGQIVVYAQHLSLKGLPQKPKKAQPDAKTKPKTNAAKATPAAVVDAPALDAAAQAETAAVVDAPAPAKAKPGKADKAAAKVKELEKAEQEAQAKLDAIRALPPAQQQGLFTAMREVQRIRDDLRVARLQAEKK